MGFLSRKNKTASPPEPSVDEQHPIVEELQEMEAAVPERVERDDQGHTSQPAGPVAAGDPPSPPVAEASSGTVPPTAPPAGEVAVEDGPSEPERFMPRDLLAPSAA